MKKLDETFRFLLLIFVVQLLGCCDAESFNYNLDINFSITENRVPVNTAFDITIDIPDLLMSNEGDENDISDIEYEFILTSYNYSNDTTINYWDFELSTIDLIVHSERIDNTESFIIGEPTNSDNGREMKFEITPTKRDTILLTIGVRGGLEGGGSCAPFHQLFLTNNQLSLENSDFNISQIVLTENLGNVILLDVN